MLGFSSEFWNFVHGDLIDMGVSIHQNQILIWGWLKLLRALQKIGNMGKKKPSLK